MKNNLLKVISGTFILLLVVFYYKSCVHRKLDEQTFYKDKNIELKVVRFLEVLPFHYVGPTVRIGCHSKNTQPEAWHKIQEHGWKEIHSHSGMVGGDADIKSLAKSAKAGYHITDVDTMIYQSHGYGISVSWDACGSFSEWSASAMPEGIIDPQPYKTCLEELGDKKDKGYYIEGFDAEGSCRAKRFYKIEGPSFSRLDAKSSGYASFTISSDAFITTKSYKIETHDYGKSWSLKPLEERLN
jgi:hypothetical protein